MNKELETIVTIMVDKYGVQAVIDALEMMHQDKQDNLAHKVK